MNPDPRELLEAERGRLLHQLAELGANEEGELTGEVQFGDGFADAGAATAERTEVIGLVDTLKGQLDAVDAALGRIANGTYGTCASCGKPIDPVRLEARPESIYCVDCKRRQ
jgi:RNA polymerase-binding transcription factor DksA